MEGWGGGGGERLDVTRRFNHYREARERCPQRQLVLLPSSAMYTSRNSTYSQKVVLAIYIFIHFKKKLQMY